MMRGLSKGFYLRRLTRKAGRMRSVAVGQTLDGTSPPSVFIGRAGYPKVLAGPLLTPQHGDTTNLDAPERWLSARKIADIVGFRLNLVRGKQLLDIHDTDSKYVSQLQDIALSRASPDTDAQFEKAPRGVTFNMDHSPFGPSGQIKELAVGNAKWDHELERAYHDTDLLAAEAVPELHRQNVAFSKIQKAFSAGTMGLGKNRKLVPTRWSITAVDSILADRLLDKVKEYAPIDSFQVYRYRALKNSFTVLLTPTHWQYEWMEAFIHVMGREEVIFSDSEPYHGKKSYSSVGGCYYSVKFAALEALARMKKQAGVLVFREAYQGYVPTGVWLCREETRQALQQQPEQFNDKEAALDSIAGQLALPLQQFQASARLLRTLGAQRRLDAFAK
ncbi:MAG: hypothetical protein HY519_02030 [Candidatus Aenigmarchaeota archaeon]|nr:hypothetical protein [Candidatus Aenigmarchaeota archaeon]